MKKITMKKVTVVPLLILLFAGPLWAAGQQMDGRTSNWFSGSTNTFNSAENDSVYLENIDLRNHKGIIFGFYLSSIGSDVDSIIFTCETSAFDDSLFDQWGTCGGRVKVTTEGFYTISAMSMTGAEQKAVPVAMADSTANGVAMRTVYPVHDYGRSKMRAWCGAGTNRTIVIRSDVKRIKY